MERKTSLDKKMALAQYIREENHGNRLKIRQREKILYGTDSQPPLYDMGKIQQTGRQFDPAAENGMVSGPPAGTFRYRMVLAILLFAGFLFCDTKGSTIAGYTTAQIHDMIMADSFNLYGGGSASDGLAALLDFGR